MSKFAQIYMYLNGKGVTQNYAFAKQWFEKAATQGDAIAQFNLGVLYANGHGVTQNYALARQWWEKAAAQGDETAKENLQILKSKGY